MPLRLRTRPEGFIEPCLPSPAKIPPAGPGWIHEIKHDGYRMMIRRDAGGVRLLTRTGKDWTPRYPLIAAAAGALKCRSCLIDGEAVITNDSGVPSFALMRGRKHDRHAFLYAFDLLSLDGADLRREPIETRKAALRQLIDVGKLRQSGSSLARKPRNDAPSAAGILYNDHVIDDGPLVFRHACAMGLEGIVSKRIGSRYLSGRSFHWFKSKNPASAAVRREREEDWGRRRGQKAGAPARAVIPRTRP